MRLGAFVTTLNRPEVLRATLGVLLRQSRPPDHLLVVDNAPSDETASVIREFSPDWIAYQPMSDNVGPAGAWAYALDRLAGEGYDWIYCGDDDDPPMSATAIERLARMAENADEQTGAVGAVGAAWNWVTGEMQRIPDDALHGLVSVDVIGGGQNFMLRKEVVSTVGVPNASFFFGLDDLEYCLRIRKAGYRLLVDGTMMHELRTTLGRLNRTVKRGGFPLHRYDTMWRQYYSTRNYIFAMNRTFQHPELARRELCKAIARTCVSWARGPRYGLAFSKMQLRGVIDGYLGRMGRTVAPVAKRTDLSAAAV